MLDIIINKNIIFLQKHGIKITTEEDKAVYKYGLQIIYYYVIDLFVIFSLAFIFGRLYETAIITFIFGLLQVFGSGYHAETPLKCLLIMIAGIFSGNILIILIADKIEFNIILIIILSIVVLILKPVTNKKHPVSKKTKQRSKIIFRISVMSILAASFILGYFSKNIEVTAIVITLNLYLISLLYAKIKNFK